MRYRSFSVTGWNVSRWVWGVGELVEILQMLQKIHLIKYLKNH